MFDLLWHLRGSVRLDGRISDSEVLDRIEQLLEQQRKPTIERMPNEVPFEEPLWSNFWASNWRSTVIYDYGRFWIEQKLDGRKLRYELRSLQAFIFCVIGALTFFVIGSLGGDLRQGLTFAALAFGWVYGMNVLLALSRVPALIRRTIRAA